MKQSQRLWVLSAENEEECKQWMALCSKLCQGRVVHKFCLLSFVFCPWDNLFVHLHIIFGYLQKQGDKVPSWKRRYFVLFKNKILNYYGSHDNTTDNGVVGDIDLRRALWLREYTGDEETSFIQTFEPLRLSRRQKRSKPLADNSHTNCAPDSGTESELDLESELELELELELDSPSNSLRHEEDIRNSMRPKQVVSANDLLLSNHSTNLKPKQYDSNYYYNNNNNNNNNNKHNVQHGNSQERSQSVTDLPSAHSKVQGIKADAGEANLSSSFFSRFPLIQKVIPTLPLRHDVQVIDVKNRPKSYRFELATPGRTWFVYTIIREYIERRKKKKRQFSTESVQERNTWIVKIQRVLGGKLPIKVLLNGVVDIFVPHNGQHLIGKYANLFPSWLIMFDSRQLCQEMHNTIFFSETILRDYVKSKSSIMIPLKDSKLQVV
ncbi:hypothetical protein RFI_04632 [Reticulomyxa filosa]|uniref:PH domain-containing protein n=1 Tax=Reticulomyxa filosa TaxID=46433 RepID=X6P328_RETFI|nr:hypothetical protein RFI_04632 [Reticulomyxa filosa]|eukprot:ETO32484.1 hypothetical protein RFI_04632 [Reticulomyxa filosa]